MKKKSLFIYGAGGLGREVLSLLVGSEEWEAAGFIDDGIPAQTLIRGIKVLGGSDTLQKLPGPVYLLLAFGDPLTKQKLALKLTEFTHIRYATLIHPQAILQDKESIRIGAGTIITAGCILTTDIRIGDHVLINLNCTIGHNALVDDYSSIMPGVNLAGQVEISTSVLVGSGANILNGIRLGERSRVGAGAVVTKDVAPGTLVVGVPAKTR